MTLIGAVELSVLPVGRDFSARLQAITDPAAEKAGLSAGRLFQRGFAAGQRGLTALPPIFTAANAEAEKGGLTAGRTYATGFSEGVRTNGQAATALAGIQGQMDRTTIAARKMAASVDAAMQTAAVASRRAEAAAAALAKAQGEAAVAAERLARGEITQAQADAAGEKAARLATVAQEAQAKATLATEKAAIRAAEVQDAAARSAAAAADAQAAAAAKQAAAADASAATAGRTLPAAVTRGANTARVIASREGGTAGRLFGTAFGNAAAPLAAVVIGAASVKLAGNFQQQTSVLVTAAGEQQKNLGLIRNGILDIATQTGTAWQDVTAATFDAEKAGNRGAKALDIVKASAEGAREEQAKLSTVTAGVTTTLKNFSDENLSSVQTVNALKTASGESKTTFEQFTAGLGNFESRAAAAKISLADVLAVYSQTINTGIGAQRASQNIGSTIQNLANPLAPARKELAQLGLDSVDLASKLGDGPGGRGLAGTLNLLSRTVLTKLGPSGTLLLNTFNQSQQAAAAAQTEFNALPPAAQKLAKSFEDNKISVADYRKESRALPGEQAVLAQQFFNTFSQAKGFQDVIEQGGPAAQTYLAALRLLVGGQQGVTVALAASGGAADVTQAKIKTIGDAAKSTDKNVSGWAITQKNFNVQMAAFKQEVERVGIELGTTLIPPLQSTLKFLGQHPGVLKAVAVGILGLGTAWVGLKIANIVTGVAGLTTRLLGLTAAQDAAAASARGLAGAEGAAGAAGAAEGAGAGAAGAAGAGGAAARAGLLSRLGPALERSPLIRVGIPIALTLVAINSAKALGGLVNDFKKGHYADGISKELSSQLAQGLTFGFSKGIANAVKSGDWTQIITSNPGYKLLSSRGLLPGGGLSGKLAPDFDKTAAAANNFWGTLDDRVRIAQFQDSLKNADNLLNSNTNTLQGNTAGAKSNREGVTKLVVEAEAAAHAYANTTGKQSDYTNALRLAIPQIEDAAAATGLNRAEVDKLVTSILGVPLQTENSIKVSGYLDALNAVNNYLIAISKIPQFVTTYINAVATGTTQVVPGGTQGTFGGLLGAGAAGQITQADGGIYRQGVPGGVVQWAEAGGESFIPHDPAKRARALDIWTQTGRVLGVRGMASGGINLGKIGVTEAEKTTASDIKAGQTAIAQAVKEGNGPLQKALAAMLTLAQGLLYRSGITAVADGGVSPQEAAALQLQAKHVTDLTAQLTKLNTVNTTLVDSLKSYVSSEQQFRDTLQGNISQGAGFTDLLKLSGSPGDLQSVLSSNTSQVKTFAAKISLLKQRGFSAAIIRDVANDGIQQGSLYADLLLSASASQVKGIVAGFSGLTAAQAGAANSITRLTEPGSIPGISKTAATTYIQTAIFTSGANVDSLVGKAEFAQRTFDSGGYLYPGQKVLANNQSGGIERVLTPGETRDYETGGAKVQVVQHNQYNGVDLATAHAQTNRDLALALAAARVGG